MIEWDDVISTGDCGDVVASLRWQGIDMAIGDDQMAFVEVGPDGVRVLDGQERDRVKAHFLTTILGEFEVVVEGSPKDVACAIDNGDPFDEDTFSKWLAKPWSPSDGTLPELLSVKADGVEKLSDRALDTLIVDDESIPTDELAHQRRNAWFLKDMAKRFSVCGCGQPSSNPFSAGLCSDCWEAMK